MKKIEIYKADWCPYCRRALALLDQKGVQYEAHDIDQAGVKEAMVERAGRTSVPQIFIDTTHHVGGCDDLYALENEGKLDSLLQ